MTEETLVGERAGRSLNFDRVAAEYDATRGGEARGAWHASLLAPQLDASRPVLEVGIGTGTVALGLARSGFVMRGIDISPAMLRTARERLGGGVVAADATRLPIADRSVAQAVSVWVLHLVGDVAAVVADVARVLQPGGRWVIIPAGGELPDPLDAIGELAAQVERQLHGGGEPGPRPTRARLEALAARSGLEVERAVQGPSITYPQSPEEYAASLERRTFSMCWDLDDATYESVVAPVVAALRAMPDADVPIQRSGHRELILVLRRPQE